ncbi:MAG TPA: glycosyltransferase family 4 protein [Bryobacteraceae bacterium]|nr:glycosyltransferase family 4 protein [Bryobacteraceae bacterium]
MASGKAGPIAILVSQHPAINHSVILREIRELRKAFDVRTVSIRSPDRPMEQLTEEERDEASRTYYIKARGFIGAFAGLCSTLARRPIRLIGGLFYALRLSKLQPRQATKNLAYVIEAIMLGDWMRRQQLRHVHVHYSSTIGLLAKRIFPIDISISFHGPDEFNDPEGFWLRQKIEASTFVRAISDYARSQLMKTCSFEQWDKIEVAYMAVDPEVFSQRPFRASPEPLEILCVGRLAPVKAQHVLVDAVALLVKNGRNVRLHLVGGGPDRQSLEERVATLGMRSQVVVHGFTPEDRLNDLYRSTDVFASASFAEGLPGVLMEAMSMEIPCVSTWITGVPELIRDGIDGLLVPPGDPGALASAIERLIEHPDLRQRIGQSGRQRILDKFHLQKNGRYLAGIFQKYVR